MESRESDTYMLEIESLPESASTAQREKRKKRKRKLNEQSIEEANYVRKAKTKKIGEVNITEQDEELRCCICTELFITAVTLTCSHTFCKYCIDCWRRARTNCPICRTKIMDSMSPTLIIDNLILNIISKCSNEVKERRIKIIQQRAAETAAYEHNADESSILLNSDEDQLDIIRSIHREIARMTNRARRRRLVQHRTR